MTALELATRLHAKRIGRDKWIATCPSHKDRRPSLRIGVGRKIPVVLCCMSQGCTGDQIIAAMGLKWSDILGDRPLDAKAARKLEQDRAEREAIRRNVRELVNRALREARRWQSRAESIGDSLARMPNSKAEFAAFHNALAKARRFEAIADMLDDDHCRGLGVPRFGEFRI